MTTDIKLFDPDAGEVIALTLREATGERLAEAKTVDIKRMREQLALAEERIDAELVRRADVALSGTIRYGEPTDDTQWEVVVPSESAEADPGWHQDKVEEALADLIAAGELTEEGAARVIVHEVVVKYVVTTKAQARALVDEAQADPRVKRRPEYAPKLSKDGMNKLLKRAVCADAVAGARKPAGDPPRRTPKVRRIERREVRR